MIRRRGSQKGRGEPAGRVWGGGQSPPLKPPALPGLRADGAPAKMATGRWQTQGGAAGAKWAWAGRGRGPSCLRGGKRRRASRRPRRQGRGGHPPQRPGTQEPSSRCPQHAPAPTPTGQHSPPRAHPAAPGPLHGAEVKVLLLLGLADPVPVTHVPQTLLEVVLGHLIVAGRLLGLPVGESEQVPAVPEGAQLLKQEENVLFGDPGQLVPRPGGTRELSTARGQRGRGARRGRYRGQPPSGR